MYTPSARPTARKVIPVLMNRLTRVYNAASSDWGLAEFCNLENGRFLDRDFRHTSRAQRPHAAGRLRVKVAPSSGLLETVRSPPIARARSRLMASPNPVPSCPLVSDRPSWTNGSKIFSYWSGGMPGPLSPTAIKTFSSKLPHSTTTRPPLGVNLTALDSSCLLYTSPS